MRRIGRACLGQRTSISGGGLITSAAALMITLTDGELEVVEREAGCATGPQALSRVIVVNHSVRLRRPQDSMVPIDLIMTCSGGIATSEGTWWLKNAG